MFSTILFSVSRQEEKPEDREMHNQINKMVATLELWKSRFLIAKKNQTQIDNLMTVKLQNLKMEEEEAFDDQTLVSVILARHN